MSSSDLDVGESVNVPRKGRLTMQATNLSNNGREANLQNYDECNYYPNEYWCDGKSKRRNKKENVRYHKSEKWMKTRSRNDIPLGRYRGISGSSAMDEEAEAIEYDLRQDEHYFFDDKEIFSSEEASQNSRYREDSESEENSPMKLYVDGLNYLNRFFTINKSKHAKAIDFEKDLKKAKSKVRNFVKAAELSNISLEVFIDKAVGTKETFLKWKSRREKELKDGKAYHGCSNLLGELFKANGIQVHYSTIDCDDTVASFAYHYGGNVLSNDSDFFRYTSREKKPSASSLCSGKQSYFQIFSDFQLQNGELHLFPAQLRPNKKIASERIFLSPPPETRTSGKFLDRPMQWEVDEHPEIYGSLPSMYTRGNAIFHSTLRPLRQALYNRLGEKRVLERVFTWNFDERKVVWVEEEVFPNGTLDYFLDHPQAAVKFFFSHEIKPNNVSNLSWKNHLFSQQVVVASICAWAAGKSLLDKLTPIPENFDSPIPVSLHCSICDVQCNNTVSYQSHVGGKRHAKNVSAQIIEDSPKVMAATGRELYSAAMYQSHVGEKKRAKKAHINSNTIACKMCNIFVQDVQYFCQLRRHAQVEQTGEDAQKHVENKC